MLSERIAGSKILKSLAALRKVSRMCCLFNVSIDQYTLSLIQSGW